MFYSHEVLTSRKYGVATVWLVATLGSKSSLKKVTRKAILDVDVSKACETIVTPVAPMALRLQSNLLYGVTRVYSQQCGYVLTDAEAARNNMRALLKVMHQAGLEPEGVHKARPEQLILQDDPNFLPDLDLVPVDLNSLIDDFNEESQEATLSPNSSQFTIGSRQSIGGLMIPASQSSMYGGAIGGLDLFSVRGDSGPVRKLQPARLLDDDIGFTIDADGNVEMRDDVGRQPPGPSGRIDRLEPLSDGVGGALHEVQYSGRAEVPPDDDGFMILQDDFNGPETGSMGQDSVQQQFPQQETTSETAEAPLRRERTKKVLPLDPMTTVGNRAFSQLQKDYLKRMQDAVHGKETLRLNAIAKRNAEHWVLGVGTILGQSMRGPLDLFSGAALLKAFTGIDLLKTGTKRQREDDHATDTDRRVKARGDLPSDEHARGNEDGRLLAGFQNDGYNLAMDDDTIEQGREAPTPLDDRLLSSLLPWNQSAGSRQAIDALPTSTSFGGGYQPMLHSRRGSRLTSASPLIGRNRLSNALDDPLHLDLAMGADGDEEFELFGPAAQVDTQTAQQSQWQRAALGAESVNFLTFVQTAIEEADVHREEAAPGDEENEQLTGSIDFDVLLPPQSNSAIVAAQGFLHLLTLGNRNMISVQQEEMFGPISMRMVVAV